MVANNKFVGRYPTELNDIITVALPPDCAEFWAVNDAVLSANTETPDSSVPTEDESSVEVIAASVM